MLRIPSLKFVNLLFPFYARYQQRPHCALAPRSGRPAHGLRAVTPHETARLERARTLGTVETAVSKWPLGQGGRVSLILREGRRGVPNSRERVPFFPRFCRTRRRGPGWESSAPSLGARRVCVRRPSPASPRPRSLTRLRVQFGTAARWAAWSSRVLGLAPDASAALALCTCRDGRPSFFHRRADAPRSR